MGGGHLEKKERVVLVFDIGTQSTRALIVSSDGKILAKAQKGHHPAYISEKPGQAQQWPQFYYENICRVSHQLKDGFPKLFARCEAAALTAIRCTSVLLDENYEPVRPAVLWLDQRRAEGLPDLKPWAKAAVKAVGMEETLRLQYCKSHCNWIRQQEPDVWNRTKKYVLLGAYLNYRLTGRLADSSAAIVGYVPYNFKKRCWKDKNDLVRPVFDLPDEMMCEIVSPGEILGQISGQAQIDLGLERPIPLVATGTDKACEVIGLGCVNSKTAAISLGTTATITFTTGKYMEPERFIPPYTSILPEHYTPEIEIFRGYWLISWFKKEFAQKEVIEAVERGVKPEEVLNEKLKTIPPGCDGLILQPYFSPNLTMPEARGAAIGLSDVHTRLHLYRAIIEGINFALLDGMRHMEKKGGFRFKEIRVGGGGSSSSEICQIAADMFGIPIVRTQTYEVAGVGAAIPVFVRLGVFSDYKEAIRKMVHRSQVFEPDEKNHQFYTRLYNDVYRQIYPRMAALYKKMKKLEKEQDKAMFKDGKERFN